MADGKIELEIVTPKGLALRATADEVTAPSVRGEFGVMPDHLPMVAATRTGIVSYRQGSDTKRCAVGPGFAEAGANKLLILAEHYVERDGVDPVVVRKELAAVQSELEKAHASLEATPEARAARSLLVARESWLATQLDLYGDPPLATTLIDESWERSEVEAHAAPAAAQAVDESRGAEAP